MQSLLCHCHSSSSKLSGLTVDQNFVICFDRFKKAEYLQIDRNVRCARVAERTQTPSSQKPLWHKASPPDIEQYQDYLDASLNTIPAPFAAFSCTDQWCTIHRDDLESYYETLVEMSIAAERCCIPHSSPRVSNHQIPGWDRFIKPLKRDACFWHAIWKSCGSPAQGTVAGIRRSTRSRYHRAIRALKRNEELVRFAEMGDRFLQDERNGFWTEVKKIKGRSSCTPSMVDGKCTEEEIADAFSTKYPFPHGRRPCQTNLPGPVNGLVGWII